MPDVLRSGDHRRIDAWRRAQALARTRDLRPDLIEARGGISDEEQQLLAEHGLATPGSAATLAGSGRRPAPSSSGEDEQGPAA
ncbi:hypothetical protein B7486_68865 [cyanobacterium TDX16]|nr:hypothetical protein B7486_68865 [cyanobacterium TDX16]